MIQLFINFYFYFFFFNDTATTEIYTLSLHDALPIWWPVTAFHHRAVPSMRPLARVLPPGLNATELTSPVWPVRGFPICRPVVTSHSRTAPSAPALAKVLPSRLNATDQTGPVWPV